MMGLLNKQLDPYDGEFFVAHCIWAVMGLVHNICVAAHDQLNLKKNWDPVPYAANISALCSCGA
eukprot:6346731-Ditylum_brightwellii.AAC.1